MPVVWIPTQLRSLTAGQQTLTVAGATVGQVIDVLEQSFPGIKNRLCEGDGLRPGLAAVVGTQVARLGLDQPVPEDSEVHFVLAIGGGAAQMSGEE